MKSAKEQLAEHNEKYPADPRYRQGTGYKFLPAGQGSSNVNLHLRCALNQNLLEAVATVVGVAASSYDCSTQLDNYKLWFRKGELYSWEEVISGIEKALEGFNLETGELLGANP